MAGYVLSRKSAEDLRHIAEYTFQRYGPEQAQSYGMGLEDCLNLLADNPGMGRDYAHIRPGIRRFDHERHAIFYLARGKDVLIVRVLHQRQDARRWL